ncbi:UDP-N-acetyl glucosamine 2-epimerase, partial [Salmonella enterica subsp. enterica serovar Weltevreden]|nr:UDP-N-acetyl glucosamine 2-epimerase [Salmonella enterica subsp. enterica serovar Weltevreden]
RMPLLDKNEFEESIGFNLAARNLLVTFHPVTLEETTAEAQFSELLAALDELKDTHLIFTKANSDTSGRVINQMIDDYVSINSYKAVAFTSL